MTDTTQPKMVKVVVFNDDNVYDFPTNPNEFLKFWQDKFDLIPDEHKDSGYIYTDKDSGYIYTYNVCQRGDSCYLNVEIGYKRPQTEDEAKEEESDKKAKYELLKARNLRKIARLKAMYEDE